MSSPTMVGLTASAAQVSVFAPLVFAVVVARLIWWRFVSPRRLSRQFVAWELEFLRDGMPQSLGELRSFLITQSDFTEQEFETLSKFQRRRWERAFWRSIATMAELGLIGEIGQASCQLTGLGVWVAAKERPSIRPSSA